MIYKHQLMPQDDIEPHVPFEECPCKPIHKRIKGIDILWHRSFDKRETWMAVELMLGMICHEHLAHVERGKYTIGQPHDHIEEPVPYIEG